MDVIALHQAGITNAVAPLGTAITEAQIEALWRLAPEPVLFFDGDAPGRRGVEGDRSGDQMPFPTPPRKGSRSSNSPWRPSDFAAKDSAMSEIWYIPACHVAMCSSESAVEWSRL